MIDFEHKTAEVKFNPHEMKVELTSLISPPEEEGAGEKKYQYLYSRAGVFYMKGSRKSREPDLLDTMAELSKPAVRFFVWLKRRTDRRTNIAVISKPATPTDRVTRIRAVKELVGVNLIAKAGVRRFMLNPHHIQPPLNVLEEVHTEWFHLTGEALDESIAEDDMAITKEMDSFEGEPTTSSDSTATDF